MCQIISTLVHIFDKIGTILLICVLGKFIRQKWKFKYHFRQNWNKWREIVPLYILIGDYGLNLKEIVPILSKRLL